MSILIVCVYAPLAPSTRCAVLCDVKIEGLGSVGDPSPPNEDRAAGGGTSAASVSPVDSTVLLSAPVSGMLAGLSSLPEALSLEVSTPGIEKLEFSSGADGGGVAESAPVSIGGVSEPAS